MRLQGKNALVTGASRGIGRAIALAFAKEGANVAFTYTKDEEGASITERLLLDEAVQGLAIRADGSDEVQAQQAVKEVERNFGAIDILVNNAGITKDNLLIRMSAEDFSSVLDVNLKSAFLLTKACARGMMKNRAGRIINISSIVGVTGNAGQANYAASKESAPRSSCMDVSAVISDASLPSCSATMVITFSSVILISSLIYPMPPST